MSLSRAPTLASSDRKSLHDQELLRARNDNSSPIDQSSDAIKNNATYQQDVTVTALGRTEALKEREPCRGVRMETTGRAPAPRANT